MQYERIHQAIFLERPNRFIAHVRLEGALVVCHVKNTGRCRELLVPGATVFIQEAENPNRRTKYDLIAVYKGDLLINMDSQAPNAVVAEWIEATHPFGDYTLLRREVAYRNSRFDLYLETAGRPLFAEVKGVTLEENGTAMFPDAPTARGLKHLVELCGCIRDGYRAAAIFLIQMKGVDSFRPNSRTDPAFAQALADARACGVELIALDCRIEPDSILADSPIPILLES